MKGPTSPTSDPAGDSAAPRRRREAGRDRDAGFTLIELMMALAVMALIAALALPRVYPSAGTTAGRTAAYAVAATLRRDRAEALRTGTPVTTRIDARAGSVTSGATGGRVTLPPGLSLATRAMDDDGITFRPDGSASGGALVLARGETAYSVLVIPLTGGVQIVTGAP